MRSGEPRRIELIEYESKKFPISEIGKEVGMMIWRNYSRQVEVEFPNPKTDEQWQLTARGWVGRIPLNSEMELYLEPKVPLENIFGMLEYAYNLDSFEFLDGLTDCSCLAELYERLAKLLALKVLDRGRKGLHRAYQPQAGRLPYVRGRLDMRRTCLKPWKVNPECHYEEHTPDVEDNQILAWTLQRILHSGVCTERSLPQVRQAYRTLRGLATPMPFGPQDCVGRIYNRLNQDYHPIHALCRFFLEQSGPGHRVGDRTMIPFLVNMARLYELFVAEWIKVHLPPEFSIEPHEKVIIGQGGDIRFDIDMVMYEKATQRACCVLDTKYKAPTHPENADISQVVTYATTKRCHNAVLIYPSPVTLNDMFGDIRVSSLTFSFDGDLDEAGQTFLQHLFCES